ncbi:MAG: glycosyltransferase family 2 protein [Candidatus Weimeria sp.]
MPEISIITPVYNAGPYLKNTIASVTSQRFSSYEWLICDDGSTDDSGEILSEAASLDQRIHVFSQKNQGVSAARNTCLRHVSGRYLMFLDADDALGSDCLSRLHEKMSSTGADLCIYGWYIHHGEDLFSYVFKDQEMSVSFEAFYELILMYPLLCGGGYPWNKIWKIDSFEELPLFDENLRHYEDKLWTLQCLDLLKSPSVAFLNEPLYHYFLRESSLSHSATPEAYMAMAGYTLDSLEAIRAYIKKAHPQALSACDELIQKELAGIRSNLEP